MANIQEELESIFADYQKNINDVVYGIIDIDSNIFIIDNNFDIGQLNFTYDDGYGLQHLLGTIVFKDGSWLERGEYDGSEWWEYKITPTKEEVLKYYK